MDYCTAGPQYSNGSFIADSKVSFVINGSQQQFLMRNSQISGWSNAVWNQVFSGVVGAPGPCFPSQPGCGGPYTTLASSPVTREAPYLYVDAQGQYNVFVPAVQDNSVGTTWAGGATPGSSIPIQDFFIARPTDAAITINIALASGHNVIFTPGVYHLDRSIDVKRPDTVVLGLGFPTLVPSSGDAAMSVTDVIGVKLSGLLFDAGPVKSPVLLEVGKPNAHRSDPADPTALHDVFFRIGGAAPGSATVSLIVNSDNVILDDIWAWRADHGNGVGWTQNTADTGVIVNGDNVTAYGLIADHYQKFEAIWNGSNGTDIFFGNEMPSDQPNQAAWMTTPTVNGWAAFKVANSAAGFHGYGMISYCLNQNVVADHAFEVPATMPAGSLQNLSTVYLGGAGSITHVVNDTGASVSSANPDVPATVVSFP